MQESIYAQPKIAKKNLSHFQITSFKLVDLFYQNIAAWRGKNSVWNFIECEELTDLNQHSLMPNNFYFLVRVTSKKIFSSKVNGNLRKINEDLKKNNHRILKKTGVKSKLCGVIWTVSLELCGVISIKTHTKTRINEFGRTIAFVSLMWNCVSATYSVIYVNCYGKNTHNQKSLQHRYKYGNREHKNGDSLCLLLIQCHAIKTKFKELHVIFRIKRRNNSYFEDLQITIELFCCCCKNK